ncbi:MAG: Mth938-like domain-containing protein [Alphaproteobacteria bacterium]
MENITPPIPAGRQVIDAYAPGRFRISGTPHSGSVIVFPERSLAWPVRDLSEVTLDSLAAVTAADPRPEILLLGAGAIMQMPPQGLRSALRSAGIGFEIMDTGAACRTYNVLLAEGRRVAAALIALPS